MKYRGVIFDLDGTLVNTEYYANQAWNNYLSSHNYDIKLMPHNLLGATRKDCAAAFRQAYGKEFDYEYISAEVMKKKFEMYDGAESLVKAGLREMLVFLERENIRISIGTSSYRPYVDRVLKLVNLHETFDIIVTGETVTKGKPDPETFIRAAEMMKLSSAECLVIEDSENGVKAGLAGGFQVLHIPDSGLAEGDLSTGNIATDYNICKKKAHNPVILDDLVQAMIWMKINNHS